MHRTLPGACTGNSKVTASYSHSFQWVWPVSYTFPENISLYCETNSGMVALNAWGEFQSADWEGWWCISSKWTLVSVSNRPLSSEGCRKTETIFFLLRCKAIINSKLSILDKGCMCIILLLMFIFCYSWHATSIRVKACSLISRVITSGKQTPDCLVKVWEMLICSSVFVRGQCRQGIQQ